MLSPDGTTSTHPPAPDFRRRNLQRRLQRARYALLTTRLSRDQAQPLSCAPLADDEMEQRAIANVEKEITVELGRIALAEHFTGDENELTHYANDRRRLLGILEWLYYEGTV